MSDPLLASLDDPIELVNEKSDPTRADLIRRLPAHRAWSGPLRLSAEIRTDGVTGPPGIACAAFFNLEYATGPIFWDVFLYPDTGSTPWRVLSCDARARGELRTAELHVRFHARGRFRMRNVRVEALEPWTEDADTVVAVFGDSTDMTCYLPYEHRLTRQLELLLRDRFPDRRIDVHGLAEGGETLTRLIRSGRLDRELAALPRCDVAMIRYGLNDRNPALPPDTFGPLLREACDRIRARFPSARLVISTTLPAEGVAVFNRQAAAVAAERNLPLIDLEAYMRARCKAGDWDWHHDPGRRIGRWRDKNPPENPDGLKGDLHPNAHGARLVAACYADRLESLLAEM